MSQSYKALGSQQNVPSTTLQLSYQAIEIGRQNEILISTPRVGPEHGGCWPRRH